MGLVSLPARTAARRFHPDERPPVCSGFPFRIVGQAYPNTQDLLGLAIHSSQGIASIQSAASTPSNAPAPFTMAQ
jgi:hypothetical protein